MINSLEMDPCEIARGYLQISPTGWWFQPLCKITVSWDYKSQHMESHKSHVPRNLPNHQPILKPSNHESQGAVFNGTVAASSPRRCRSCAACAGTAKAKHSGDGLPRARFKARIATCGRAVVPPWSWRWIFTLW